MDQISRYRGSLLGMAVCDAVGTTLEFTSPNPLTGYVDNRLTDMVGGGPFNLEVGEWTDDTSMGLCLAASLIECKEFNPVDQMERYYRWWQEGYMSSNGECFDMGGTTRTAMRKFEMTWEPYCGPTDPKAAGNGSIMRLAAIPMFYAQNYKELMRRAVDSSRTTHGATTCIDSCRYLALIIAEALNGATKEELLSPNLGDEFFKDHPLHPEVEKIRAGSFKQEPPDINGDGYVITTLEAALWAFNKTSDFKSGCLEVVNLGLDSDTTGAVYGQIAGAFYGDSGIPADWLSKLVSREMITEMAEQLYGLSNVKTETTKA